MELCNLIADSRAVTRLNFLSRFVTFLRKDRRSSLRVVSVVSFCILKSVALNAGELVKTECEIDSIKEFDTAGELVITDYALIPPPYNKCPRARFNIEKPISYKGGKLFLWVRFQGDLNYLESPESKFRPYSKLERNVGGNWVFIPQRYSLQGILLPSAKAEAEKLNGKFDWRDATAASNLIAPGHYRITILQGGKAICLVGIASAASCEIEFYVE
jgi:hypothetical protein